LGARGQGLGVRGSDREAQLAATRKKRKARTYTIRLTRVMPYPPARVLRALTDSGELRAWSGATGRVAARVGGAVSMWDGWNTGTLVARRPPTTLAYTWRTESWKPGVPPSVVRWRLTRVPGGTRVSLVHSRLPNLREYRGHRGGWTKYFLAPMEEYLRSGG
jgi:uncharacterized protein YndB with AHSA1/START domain